MLPLSRKELESHKNAKVEQDSLKNSLEIKIIENLEIIVNIHR